MKINKLVIIALIFLVITTGVYGLGVSPAKKIVNYQQGEVQAGTFRILKEKPGDLDISLEVEGEYAGMIELEKTKYTLSEYATEIPFSVKMDYKLPPGETKVQIYVEELGSSIQINSQGISARVKIPYTIILQAPYPDKYIKAEVRIKDDANKVEFVSYVSNVGSEKIDKLKTFYDVMEEEVKMTTLVSNENSLDVNKDLKISSELSKEQIQNGEYETLATINYDDKHVEIKKKFHVGEPVINLTHYDRYFPKGEIAKMNLELFNDWNKRIEEASVKVQIVENSMTKAEAKSSTFTIGKYETKPVEIYLDTAPLKLGNYDAKIITTYLGKTTTENVKLEILSQKEYSEKQKDMIIIDNSPSTFELVMFGTMILLVIVLIAILLYILNMLRNRKI